MSGKGTIVARIEARPIVSDKPLTLEECEALQRADLERMLAELREQVVAFSELQNGAVKH
jgi:hypothetical protein